jgi:recombination endonuclease VII
VLNLEKRREGRRRYYRKHKDKELTANRKWKEEHATTVKGYILAQKERIAGRPRPEICELCGEKPRKTDKRHGIHFDHCHITGKFRGWLCYRCNNILGQVRDKSELLRRLADYLDAHA